MAGDFDASWETGLCTDRISLKRAGIGSDISWAYHSHSRRLISLRALRSIRRLPSSAITKPALPASFNKPLSVKAFRHQQTRSGRPGPTSCSRWPAMR